MSSEVMSVEVVKSINMPLCSVSTLVPYFPVYKSNLCISRPPVFSQKMQVLEYPCISRPLYFARQKFQNSVHKSSKLVTKNHASNTKKTQHTNTINEVILVISFSIFGDF